MAPGGGLRRRRVFRLHKPGACRNDTPPRRAKARLSFRVPRPDYPEGSSPSRPGLAPHASMALEFHRTWGGSSAGRAPRSHRGGQGFDPPPLHHRIAKGRGKPRPFFVFKKPSASGQVLTFDAGHAKLQGSGGAALASSLARSAGEDRGGAPLILILIFAFHESRKPGQGSVGSTHLLPVGAPHGRGLLACFAIGTKSSRPWGAPTGARGSRRGRRTHEKLSQENERAAVSRSPFLLPLLCVA